jgi:hypothetical protein
MKRIAILILLTAGFSGYSQTGGVQLNAEKITMYSPYMAARHGGPQGLEAFKSSNHYAYTLEMWYFTESFYVKKDHNTEGATFSEAIVDITRFEQYRKANEDAIVVLPGFKDALVLLAANKLIYKPSYSEH